MTVEANYPSPHAVVLIDPSNGLPYAATNGGGGVAISAGTNSTSTGTVVFSNANSVTFGMDPSGVVTASVSVTAAPSPVNVTGANGSSVNAQTIAFSNANGLSLGVSTAAGNATVTGSYTVPTQSVQTQASGNIAGSGFATTTTNGVVILGTQNSLGETLAVPPYITTWTAPSSYVSAVNGSSGALSLNVGSSLSSSTNGSSITFGLASNITTALQSTGNYLTTARASNDAIGLNTAETNVTWTVNSSGLSLNAAGYAGTATAATNATFTLNSAGLSLSVGAVGGATTGGLYVAGNTTGQSSSSTYPISSLNVSGAGLVSAGWSSNSLIISGPNTTGISQSLYATSNTTQGTSGTVALGSVLFAGAGNVSVGVTNGSVVVSDGAAAVSLSGNSTSAGAGYSNVSSGTLILAGGNNITLSQNGASVTISAANAGGAQTGISGIADSAHTQTIGTLSLANSNGFSWGLSTGNSTGTLTVSYTVPTSFVQQVNGSSGSISLAVGSSLSSSTNGSSITFGLASNITTALQSTGAYLTTAAQSSVSNVSAIYAATNNTGGGTATLSGGVSFSDANGLTFYTSAGNAIVGSYSVPAVPTSYVSNVNGSSGAISLAVGSSLSSSTNGSSITFGLASNITTALQSTGAYLTTAAQSSVSNVSGILAATNNTGGGTATLSGNVSFSDANGLTFYTSAGNAVVGSYTVPSVTQYFSNTATTFNGANISGSITLNTAGLNLSMSVAAPGGGGSYNIVSMATSTSGGATSGTTYSTSAGTIGLVAGSNITLQQSNNSIVIFGGAGGGGGAMYANLLGNDTAGNTTASGSTLGLSGLNLTLSGTNNSQIVFSAPATSSLVGSNGVNVSTNGSTISILGTPTYTALSYANRQLGASSLTTAGAGSIWVAPCRLVAPVTASTAIALVSLTGSASSATSGQFGFTANFAIYSQNPTSTQEFDTFTTAQITGSMYFTTGSITYAFGTYTNASTTSNGLTGFYGYRIIPWTITTVVPAGLYLFASQMSTSTAGYASVMRTCGNVIDNPNAANAGYFGSATNASIGYADGGTYATTSTTLPASLNITGIVQTQNQMPFFKIGAI